eukprot:gene11296-11446_t
MVERSHSHASAALNVVAAALLLCVAGVVSAQKTGEVDLGHIPNVGKAKLQIKVKPAAEEDMPKASNPYEGKSYGGCPGGFCPPKDAELEREFWHAADVGDAKVVKKLLSNPNLNISRNIVPDDQGMARVIDVAVWVASYKGHKPVMKVLLEHPGVLKMFEYEDGHTLDLAAGKGDLDMVNFLMEKKMAVSPTSMAHAAHYNHTKIMKVLLTKPMDLKAAMQAITNGGNDEMAKLMTTVMKLWNENDPSKGRPNQHNWHAEYLAMAVNSGNMPVLKILLADVNDDIPWQDAQSLVMSAAERGNPKIMELLLAQKVFQEDEEELDETIDNGLKVAAEMGSLPVLDLMIKKYPDSCKAHCKAAVFKALKFGQDEAVERLLKICKVDLNSDKLQKAAWYGNLFKAARTGDVKLMEQVMDHDHARTRILALRQPKLNEKGKVTAYDYPHAKQDPLVIAATAGHAAVVRLLSKFNQLCQGCAAAEAVKNNHTDLARELIDGAASFIKVNSDQLVQYALRVVAHGMENHHWDLVEHMLKEHKSVELGPYFLPAIAQEGKMDDLEKMLNMLAKLGYDKTPYFKDQVHSSKITAALHGHVDMMLQLDQHTAPLTEDELAAAEELMAALNPNQGGGDDDGNLEEFMQETGRGAAPPHQEL